MPQVVENQQKKKRAFVMEEESDIFDFTNIKKVEPGADQALKINRLSN